jgi:DNA adenine methylase
LRSNLHSETLERAHLWRDTDAVEPFLKWAGGKRWAIQKLVAEVPESYGTYIEPFLGGGSLFFAVLPQRARLSDANAELINAYRMVCEKAGDLERWLRWLQRYHSKDLYYKIRSRPKGGDFWAALRFIYLNRTCWNGLYRVNLRGEFNVPIGTKDLIEYRDGLCSQARVLKRACLQCADFEVALSGAKTNDFAYVDPPYTVRHNNNGFIKYNEKIFGWSDQERLRDEVKRATDRGVKVLVSNAAHDSVRELYHGVGTLIEVERSSVLAASPSYRRREKEIIVKCY